MQSQPEQQQVSLFDYHDPAEFVEEDFDKVVIIHLRPPTNRKQDRIENAVNEAAAITREAEQRLPSVPRERWGSAQLKGNTWYKWAKEFNHDLSNKTAVANIQRVREAFRRWQSEGYDGTKPSFGRDDRCTFDYNQPKYECYDDQWYLSLPFAAGRGERELLPIKDGEYVRSYITGLCDDDGSYQKTRSELLRRSGGYEFHQGVRETVAVLENPRTIIGVDIGLTNLAVVAGVDADGEKRGAELWSGGEHAEHRDRYYRQKKRAQSEQKYEQIRDEESRYVEHICHTVSRAVVEWALDKDRPQIVMEELTDIRDTFIEREREHTPDERRALHSWPFRKLQDMIAYKSQEAGIPAEYLSPDETRYTSRECNKCGHSSEENRDGVHFECGYHVNADVNGAINIAQREVEP